MDRIFDYLSKEEIDMEHNPYMTLSDETVITYSDLKKKPTGEEFVTVYFETPSEKNGFNSMDIEYPGKEPMHVEGYTHDEISKLMYHYDKVGKLIFMCAKEDSTYA